MKSYYKLVGLIGCLLVLPACSKREPLAYDGLTLFAPLHSNEVQLRDNMHRVVHRWECELPPGQITKLMPDGSLLRTARLSNPAFEKAYGKGNGGRVDWLEWDGTKRWEFSLSNDRQMLHHDIEIMANGHILMLVWHKIPVDESAALGCQTSSEESPILSEQIIEVDPATNEIVWQWNAWDHLIQSVDSSLPNYGQPAMQPGRIDVNLARDEIDWLHFNSISYSPKHDLIAVSCRQTSEIWLIDHSTTTDQAQNNSGGKRGVGGDIWRRWGNSDGCRELVFQHNVNWIRDGLPGAGNLLVFDNGEQDERKSSRVLELRFNENKSGPKAFDIVWEYWGGRFHLYSTLVSGAQRLPNGNTLVCSGTQGWIVEVDRDGEICWQYRFEVADRYDWLFRVEKYPWEIASKNGISKPQDRPMSAIEYKLTLALDNEMREGSLITKIKAY